jgi:TonB family protein
VLMPKNPSTETAKFPYHKMELSVRLYISSLPSGPVLAVASLSGIKSNPALYTDFQRFNSYVDAFKTWFPSKVRAKEAPVKLTLIGNNIFHGYSGREYKMTIGDLSGTVFAYATKKRFYTIISLNTKKDDALQEKFLSSFSLPDKPPETVVANAEAAETPLPAQPNAASDDPAGTKTQPASTEGNTETPPQPNAQPTPNSPQPNPNPNAKPGETPPGGRAPISGGVLNGKAIYLPLPEVPPGDAVGTVMVQVLVDEQGTVVSARAISGPAQLHQAAVNAAKFARFTPTMLMGEPVKVSGTLMYNFVRTAY